MREPRERGLIVKFFNSSEEASNWLLAKAEAVGGSAMVGAFYSHDDVYAEQPGYHMLMIPEEAASPRRASPAPSCATTML